MAEKLDYLKDLSANPDSTVGDAAKRLGATEGAVMQGYRRCAKQGDVRNDEGQPSRFSLTEKGVGHLRELEGGQRKSNPGSSQGEEPIAAPSFDQVLTGLVSQKVDERLAALADSHKESGGAAQVRELLERAERLSRPPDGDETLAEDTSALYELYGLELGLSELPRKEFRRRKEILLEMIDSQTSDSVARLVELEVALAEERDDFWGPDKEKIEALELEIAELREELGFPSADGEGAEALDSDTGEVEEKK